VVDSYFGKALLLDTVLRFIEHAQGIPVNQRIYLLSNTRSCTFTRMSSMRKSSGLIAPESRRLLREARRMKRRGFNAAAEQLASASAAQKMNEPTIGNSQERIAARDISSRLEQAAIRAGQAEAKQATQGRIGFAESIEERKNDPGVNIFEKAQAEASKFGVTPAQLTSFFKRRGIGFGTNPKTN